MASDFSFLESIMLAMNRRGAKRSKLPAFDAHQIEMHRHRLSLLYSVASSGRTKWKGKRKRQPRKHKLGLGLWMLRLNRKCGQSIQSTSPLSEATHSKPGSFHHHALKTATNKHFFLLAKNTSNANANGNNRKMKIKAGSINKPWATVASHPPHGI